MNGKYVIALLTLAVPCLAMGQGAASYQCSHGDLQRRIEILTEPGVTVPCAVHYYKDTEAPGEKQVLWSAQSQEGYCESKVQEFVARLEGWGWNCGPGGEAMPDAAPEAEPQAEPEAEADDAEAEPPVYDDTDVLSPGDPSGS